MRQFEDAVSRAIGYGQRRNWTRKMFLACPGNDFERRNADTISKVTFDRRDPYLTLCRFERDSDLDGNHGPSSFELMFACAEAIATFKAAFSRAEYRTEMLGPCPVGDWFWRQLRRLPSRTENVPC